MFSVNIDFRSDAQRIEDCLEIIIVEPDTAMRHRHPEQSLVKSAVDEISVAEAESIITQHPILKSRWVSGTGDRQPFLNKSPIGLTPDRMSGFTLYCETSARRPEDPLLLTVFGLQKSVTA